MSIDDDSMDVEAALKGKPEKAAFRRYFIWAEKLYEQEMKLKKENAALIKTISILSRKLK